MAEANKKTKGEKKMAESNRKTKGEKKESLLIHLGKNVCERRASGKESWGSGLFACLDMTDRPPKILIRENNGVSLEKSRCGHLDVHFVGCHLCNDGTAFLPSSDEQAIHKLNKRFLVFLKSFFSSHSHGCFNHLSFCLKRFLLRTFFFSRFFFVSFINNSFCQ